MNCDCCKSPSQANLFRIEAKKYAPGKKFLLKRCLKCGHTFLESFAHQSNFYPENYLPHDSKLIKLDNRRAKAMDYIRQLIFSEYQDKGTVGLKQFRRIIAWLYNKTAYRSIPGYIKDGTLLDIGCGLGSYLSILKKLGWNVQGVEKNKAAAQNAMVRFSIDVTEGSFDQIDFPSKKFDVVTLWHVLEHFKSPSAAIVKIRRLLKDDGSLIIGIPNFNSLDRVIFKEKWNGYEIPLHLHHFTPDTIQMLLKNYGFKVQTIVHTIRPSDLKKSILNLYPQRHKKKKRLMIEMSLMPFCIITASVFAALHRSSIIVVNAQKSSTI